MSQIHLHLVRLLALDLNTLLVKLLIHDLLAVIWLQLDELEKSFDSLGRDNGHIKGLSHAFVFNLYFKHFLVLLFLLLNVLYHLLLSCLSGGRAYLISASLIIWHISDRNLLLKWFYSLRSGTLNSRPSS